MLDDPSKLNMSPAALRLKRRIERGKMPSIAWTIVPVVMATFALFLVVSYLNRLIFETGDVMDEENQRVLLKVEGVVKPESPLETPPPPRPITAQEYLRMHGAAPTTASGELRPVLGEPPPDRPPEPVQVRPRSLEDYPPLPPLPPPPLPLPRISSP